MLKTYYTICVVSLVLTICTASNGDRTQFFHNCRKNCERQNCSADGIEIQEQAVKYYRQSIFDKLFQWTCVDECQYGCMWRTVIAFFERGWPIPQFYGKWPFVRMLGMQEPASALFSILNFAMHLRMLYKFRQEVRTDSPLYIAVQMGSFINLNGWIWSMIFHIRDFPLTELLDYAFAYSIILAELYYFVIRMLHRHSQFLRIILTLAFASFYINYFAYLSTGEFHYGFNMKVNFITGGLSALGWLIWCYKVRQKRPYYKRILRFYILFGLTTALELLDFPPILWIFDAHALWHLSSVPLMKLLYDFKIEDCKALRKEKQQQSDRYTYV